MFGIMSQTCRVIYLFIFIKWLILIASQLVLQTVQQDFCSHYGVKDIIINLVPSYLFSSPPQPPGARRNVKKRESGNDVPLPLGHEYPVFFGHKICNKLK